MLLLFIQLCFALVAWRKGWRWRVLIPFAGCFAFALAVRNESDALVALTSTVIGGLMTSVLGGMAIYEPRSVKAAEAAPSALAPNSGMTDLRSNGDAGRVV